MKLLIFIFLLLPIVAIFGQKDTRKAKYFLLPESAGRISVNIWRGETVERVASYEGSIRDAVTDGQRYVATKEFYSDGYTIYDIEKNTTIKTKLPVDFSGKSAFLYGDYLFVGGEGKGEGDDDWSRIEMLKSYNIATQKWANVPIPKRVQQANKAVDDIVLVGDTLIAVDDLVFPKYLIYYKLDSNGAPTLLGQVELGNDRPYESIHQARYNGEYLLLHSTSFSVDMGESAHFTLISKGDLHYYFKQDLLTSYFYWGYEYSYGYYNKKRLQKKTVVCRGRSSKQNSDFFRDVIDFVLLGENIIFCHKKLGIAKLPIDDFFSYGDASKITAENFTLPLQGEMIKMTLTPNPDKVLLSVEDEGNKVRHELVELK